MGSRSKYLGVQRHIPKPLRHEGCGGDLLKLQAGVFRCSTCQGVVKIGRSGNYGGAEGYIRSQINKGRGKL